jgi:hypothetical protein
VKEGCSVVFTQAPTLVFGWVPPQKKNKTKQKSIIGPMTDV